MRSLAMRVHHYQSDGRCVYCRQELAKFESNQVTDEHIIPRALNGSLVIRKGACGPCARQSNREYENDALNNDLLVPRRLLELKASRRRGRSQHPPQALPPVANGDATLAEGATFDIDLNRDDYPPVFSLLTFQPAGRLVGVERGEVLSNFRIQFFDFGSSKTADTKFYTTRIPMKNGPFAMMMAKIGYCYAMAEWGDAYFDAKDIRSLLLGERGDVYTFVGNTAEPERLATRHLHGLYTRRRGEWLTVLVHLFASYHGRDATTVCHPYEVVVGRAL